jgi:hypothetical protein
MKKFLIFAMLLITLSLFAQSEPKTQHILNKEQKIRFLDSLNKYRIAGGLPIFKYSFQEDSLSRLRINTIFKHIDSIGETEYKKDIIEHQHHNWKEDWDNYDLKNVHKDTVISYYGECTARLHKLTEVDDMVNHLFQGWKNSKAHWNAMMSPEYEYITLHWLDDSQYVNSDKPLYLRRGYFAALVLFSKDVNKRRGMN